MKIALEIGQDTGFDSHSIERSWDIDVGPERVEDAFAELAQAFHWARLHKFNVIQMRITEVGRDK